MQVDIHDESLEMLTINTHRAFYRDIPAAGDTILARLECISGYVNDVLVSEVNTVIYTNSKPFSTQSRITGSP